MTEIVQFELPNDKINSDFGSDPSWEILHQDRHQKINLKVSDLKDLELLTIYDFSEHKSK